MKHLIQAVNRSSPFYSLTFKAPRASVFFTPTSQPLFTSKFHFSTLINDNEEAKRVEELKAKLLQKEKELQASLSEKDRLYYQASRLALVKSIQDAANDPKTWWNTIARMNEDDVDHLPDSYIRKFGTFLIKEKEGQEEAKMDKNKSLSFYQQVQNLQKLLTNEQKEEIEQWKAKKKADAVSGVKPGFEYTRENYMQRQPRFDINKIQYNYEQFREYTALYEEAKKKDDEELKYFYKMLKYSKENPTNKSAIAFAKKFRLDLIEIPEEFKNIEVEKDFVPRKTRKSRRPVIRTRTSRELHNYDAWRTFDRELMKGGGQQRCQSKIMLSPALLVKAFGKPSLSRLGFDSSGEYEFEDNNLDVFSLNDYRQTTFYYGLNREDEYYEKYLHRRPHQRRRKWPTIQEFWESEEPKEFKLHCQDHADYRKFKAWIRKVLKEVENDPNHVPYDDQIKAKYEKDIDIYIGKDYNAKGVVNHTDLAVYNYDFRYFMTEEEIKKLPQEMVPVPLVKPKVIDFTKAERVIITKEDLKRLQEEEQESKLL